MQVKEFYRIAIKVSSRKKCYYFWWSTWLLICIVVFRRPIETQRSDFVFYETVQIVYAYLGIHWYDS